MKRRRRSSTTSGSRSAKSRDHSGASDQRGEGEGSGVESLALGSSAALLVATLLVPTESVGPDGTGLLLVLLWILTLFIWALSALLRPALRWRAGWLDLGVLVFLGWLGLSAWLGAGRGDGRVVLNSAWHWCGLGIAFLVWRQVLQTARQQRAMVCVVLALTTTLAAYGLYQYTVTIPAQVRDYESRTEEKKQQLLMERQVDPTPGSANRRQFEDRLRSTEPFATFGLTNSLAGVLAPSLILLLGIALAWDPSLAGGDRRPWIGAAAAAVLIAGCLLLTKSRSAWGAVALGALMLWIRDWRTERRIGWKLPVAAGAGLGLLLAAALLTGGLDVQVITEAGLSLTYRAQYWLATWNMIVDHPVWGVGPGNFQDYYAQYKLPQASETVADPHQFLLEIAAVTGVVGLLLFLLPWTGLAATLRKGLRRESEEQVGEEQVGDGDEETGSGVGGIYTGAALGLLIGTVNGWLMGFPLESGPLGLLPILWWLALPLGGGLLLALSGWVERGKLGLGLPAIGILVACINLSAAGGIGYPGVALPLWLLAALVANHAPPSGWTGRRQSRPRAFSGGVALALILLLAALQMSTIQPFLSARALVEQASRTNDFRNRLTLLASASAADPRWALPYRYRAEMLLQQWQQTRIAEDRVAFETAVEQWLTHDPHARQAWMTAGNWYLAMYRSVGSPQMLDQAMEYHRQAVELYPNSAGNRALLAWVLHLQGQSDAARDEALRALELDALNPHAELKLENQRLDDPGPDPRLPAAERGRQPPAPPSNSKLRAVMLSLAGTSPTAS